MFFPFEDLSFNRSAAFLDEIQRRLDRAFQRDTAAETWFDLHENDDEYVLTADLPGVSEKNLEITLHEGVLTIAAKRELEFPKNYKPLSRERVPFEWTQSFNLPAHVDDNGVTAKLKNGVLCLHLKKAASAKPRQIAISQDA